MRGRRVLYGRISRRSVLIPTQRPIEAVFVSGSPGLRPRSVEPEHGQERGVDLPLLADRDAPRLIAESVDVDRTYLLDEHTSALAGNVELRSK